MVGVIPFGNVGPAIGIRRAWRIGSEPSSTIGKRRVISAFIVVLFYPLENPPIVGKVDGKTT